ncbi:MAG TPA: Crp/Fnr family transcriptional regulator [Dehalococcoidia bacterium]|nr:Crp/Fnr family transcriptional regulator [Dehalococcoidia bacterium]
MMKAIDLLERVPFLAALTVGDREALADAVKRRRFARGHTIFAKDDPGDALYIIEDGSVRIYLPSPQGADLTLAVLGAGEFFGHLALLDGGARSASATALRETSALALDRSDFVALLQSRPQAAMAVLASVTQRLRETNETAGDLVFLNVGGRLAKKLLDLAAGHGVRRPDGILLDVPLTQEELANMLGVTRESVNRHLSSLRRQGAVSREGRRFLIRDVEALRRYID